jgi:two-component system, OmpR family, heavy metal sensor histidine kinase CusS
MSRLPPTKTLAWRLTALYVGLASIVLLAAVWTLYFELIRDLDREDDALMREHALLLDALLLQPQQDATKTLLQLERERELLGARRMLVRIVDHTGSRLVATSRFPQSLPIEAFPSPMDARHAPLRAVDVDADGIRYRAATVQLESTAVGGQEAVLQIAIDRTTVQLLLARYRNLMLAVAIPGVLMSGLIGFLVARRATAPLRLLAERIGGIHAQNLDARVPVSGMVAELHPVVDSFNDLLRRLRTSFDRLRNFSSHLAHELRTPIHTMCAEIDTSLPSSTPDQQVLLQSIRTEADQMAKVIDGLLFLAYADRPGARLASRRCDLRELAAAAVEYYEASATEGGIVLTGPGDAPVPADVDPTLLQRALSNLLANALAFTPRGGRVEVRAFAQPDCAVIEVEDDGVGIAPERLQSILDSAFHTDPTLATDRLRTGLGLGLQIVDSIMRLHSGTLRVRSEPGAGCLATLRVPAPDARFGSRGSSASVAR